MVGLCFVPTRTRRSHSLLPKRPTASVASLFLSSGAGTAVGLGMLLLSVGLLQEYGVALFIGAPFVMGTVSAYLFNRTSRSSFAATFGVSQLTLLVASLTILMFALEGVICILMSYPIATILATMGAFLGHAMSERGYARGVTCIVLALPLLLTVDVAVEEPPLNEVMTSIEIDASPERVWANVVDFPALPRPRELLFRSGVAYPVRARIEGNGVGAVRYCEFSTGAFVEPITVWDEPLRLAFDVTDQPEPMKELSPYSRVFAPHLADGLVSRRGEFRLVPLPDGRTRLEGRTWYTLDMFPQPYWRLWSDFVIRTIHLRVLDHIRGLPELA